DRILECNFLAKKLERTAAGDVSADKIESLLGGLDVDDIVGVNGEVVAQIAAFKGDVGDTDDADGLAGIGFAKPTEILAITGFGALGKMHHAVRGGSNGVGRLGRPHMGSELVRTWAG